MRWLSIALTLSGVLAGAAWADPPLVDIAASRWGTRVVADSQFDGQYGGAALSDGVIAKGPGCWFSADQIALPCAVTFQFAGRERIAEAHLFQSWWEGSMYHSRQVAVEVSDDGQAWRRVGECELPDESGARVDVPLTDAEGSWLRVVVLSSYIPYQTCGLAEVELMASGRPMAGAAEFADGDGLMPASLPACGLQVLGREGGAQAALTQEPARYTADLRRGEMIALRLPVEGASEPLTLTADVHVADGRLLASLSGGGERVDARLSAGESRTLSLEVPAGQESVVVEISGRALRTSVATWSNLTLTHGGKPLPVNLAAAPPWQDTDPGPPPETPSLRPAVEAAMIEWDWRLRDGIGNPRSAGSYADALAQLAVRGDALAASPDARGPSVDDWRQTADAIRAGVATEALWLQAHRYVRSMFLAQRLARSGPLVFVKQVPGAFSHQLTQYYGRYARPGGGVFVLEEPGYSMRVRSLTEGSLPLGSVMQPEVSFDGTKVLFSFCEAPTTPEDRTQGHHGRYYHVWRVNIDGGGLTQLTDGPFDDLAPKCLPDGRLGLVSTRRGGWHRCGSPGCENYTLAIADSEGAVPQTVSWHETQEWDPALLDDGRIVYTRWDYVDRHAIFYEQLWTVRTDGGNPSIFFGNNTLNPVGIWEARSIPGSQRIMATAAAHHGMTAGSIILVDPNRGVDGLEPIQRLTPETPFPESESLLRPWWRAPAGAAQVTSVEEDRWPGHCWRSPYPLSEETFLAAYSYDALIGEPQSNVANMFGLYLADAEGNRELLYRDPNIASLQPLPLRPRPVPPSTHGVVYAGLPKEEGVVVINDVRESYPNLPEPVHAIRVLHVVPKSTSGANNPTVGLAFASPGKEVLGTVPVRADGSVWFRAPAGMPLAFQALDERGRALQVMRSVTYVQPGGTLTCTGCHEPRTSAPPNRAVTALEGEPLTLRPGPDGSRPLSYPLLVQPVLDAQCVSCHGGAEPAGGLRLTGEPEGRYTASYNALAPRVSLAQWDGGANFREVNSEPLAQPLFFGARGSALGRLLDAGHHGVSLTLEEEERLVTWMDANGLFYGTFDPGDQMRQQLGERIAGPALQ